MRLEAHLECRSIRLSIVLRMCTYLGTLPPPHGEVGTTHSLHNNEASPRVTANQSLLLKWPIPPDERLSASVLQEEWTSPECRAAVIQLHHLGMNNHRITIVVPEWMESPTIGDLNRAAWEAGECTIKCQQRVTDCNGHCAHHPGENVSLWWRMHWNEWHLNSLSSVTGLQPSSNDRTTANGIRNAMLSIVKCSSTEMSHRMKFYENAFHSQINGW